MSLRKKVITAADVAKTAGVSQSAVSRTFTPGASVSAKTRQKVHAAARLLGYQPNAIARSLITQRTNIVGVVIGDTMNPYNCAILEEATRRLQAAGRQVMLFMMTPDLGPGDSLPNALQYQLDGVLISIPVMSPAMVEQYAEGGTPIVLINRSLTGFDFPIISVDNAGGGRMVAEFLVDTGHRRIAFLNGVPSSTTNELRRAAFFDALLERGAPPPVEDVGHYTYDGGFRAATRLLSAAERPDAIFCANDLMALGALNAARFYLGLRVPEDVSIVGFDNIAAASWPDIQLTTIDSDPAEMARHGVDTLIAMIDSGNTEGVSETKPVRLVVRRTTRTKK